jgi:hypothetical protein
VCPAVLIKRLKTSKWKIIKTFLKKDIQLNKSNKFESSKETIDVEIGANSERNWNG